MKITDNRKKELTRLRRKLRMDHVFIAGKIGDTAGRIIDKISARLAPKRLLLSIRDMYALDSAISSGDMQLESLESTGFKRRERITSYDRRNIKINKLNDRLQKLKAMRAGHTEVDRDYINPFKK